jgi:HEAT repeat protein
MAPMVALEPLRNAVLALAAAVGMLAMFLLLQRSMAWVNGLRSSGRIPLLTRRVYEAVQSVPVDVSALGRLNRFDRRLVRSILLGLALDLRGDTGEALTELYRRLGFLQRDVAALRSWRASRRANAAADLGLIRAREAISGLLGALHDRDMRVRQAAVWAIGQAGDAATLAGLVRVLGDRNLVVAHRAQEVLAERGREVPEAIVSYAEKTASRSGRLASIELIGWLRISTAGDLLLAFTSDMDPEIRVKSVKAAAALGDPRFLSVFHARLEDPSWPVRCQAAKGLSVMGSAASVEPLAGALRDKQWWVRFYAATALAEIGGGGQDALNQALTDPEQLVRDMARYLLERGQAVPVLP